MSLLFTKLHLPVTRWTDEDFASVYNSREFVDYETRFGYNKDIWQRWWSYVERQNPQLDYTQPPRWLFFLCFHKHRRTSLDRFHVPQSILNHLNQAMPHYSSKLAKEEAAYKARQEKELEEWRVKKKWVKVEIEKRPVAFVRNYSKEDNDAIFAKTKTLDECRQLIREEPLTTLDAVIEVRHIYDESDPNNHKLKDILVECTNYGLTYSPEDMLAINSGKKKIEKCKPIVKNYECPIITINEEVKAEILKTTDPKTRWCDISSDRVYTRSDAKEWEAKNPKELNCAKRWIRRPGTPRRIGGGSAI